LSTGWPFIFKSMACVENEKGRPVSQIGVTFLPILSHRILPHLLFLSISSQTFNDFQCLQNLWSKFVKLLSVNISMVRLHSKWIIIFWFAINCSYPVLQDRVTAGWIWYTAE
jgi:hypothetical protein